jgi:hypothetical protein
LKAALAAKRDANLAAAATLDVGETAIVEETKDVHMAVVETPTEEPVQFLNALVRIHTKFQIESMGPPALPPFRGRQKDGSRGV